MKIQHLLSRMKQCFLIEFVPQLINQNSEAYSFHEWSCEFDRHVSFDVDRFLSNGQH